LTLFSTPTTSRLAALLLLVTAVLVVYMSAVEPIISGYSETRSEIEAARDQLARLERAAAMRPALSRHIEDFEKQRASQGYLLAGSTDALAAANLQDRVQALIIENGGTAQSMQSMPGVEEHGLMRITLRVQMTGTTETLLDVLYALESGSPILFIDNVDIQGRESVKAGYDLSYEAEVLRVAVDLSGYLPKEARR
jgi:general secretion pathway protein M